MNEQNNNFGNASENLRFSASVALFGMILRESKYKGKTDFNTVLNLARESTGKDPYGYRSEFLRLVKLAGTLKNAS